MIYKKILVVVNLKSGVGLSQEFHDRLINFADKNNLQYEELITTGKNDRQVLMKQIKKFKPDLVYAVGGDGTINLVASALIKTNITLGIFPAGSANGLAYNLGITNDIDTALSAYLSTKPVTMDTIVINKKYYCFHLADIGLNARIVSRFDKEGSRGMLGYGKHLLKEIIGQRNLFHFYLYRPGQPKRRMRSEMIVFANAKSYGTGAKINPTGKINDGKFELVILRPYPWWFVFTFFYAVFTGKLHKMKYVRVYSLSEVKVELTKKHELQIDGEIISGIKNITAEVIPDALKIIPGTIDRD